MRRPIQNLGLLLASLVAVVALFELGLRFSGFRFDIAPESIEFGWPDPVQRETLFEADRDLFWVPEGYPYQLEKLQRDGVDLVFLGDSCTATGEYPALLSRDLRRRFPGIALRAVKTGVPGWSSYQGLLQLERDVLPMHPRIATFLFGWNDHWIGFGVEDKDIHALRVSAIPALSSLRSAQYVFKGLIAWRASRVTRKPNRVSPEDFAANLSAMARVSRDNGIVPVFITAPTSHERGREPEYLAERYLRRLEDLVPLHRQYADIVREVAASEGGVLCDVAAAFEALPDDVVLFELMRKDGIHQRTRGDEEMARVLLECFESSDELRAALESLRSRPGSGT